MSTNTKSPDWHYIYSERLGIMCGDGKATPEQVERAKVEADGYEATSGGIAQDTAPWIGSLRHTLIAPRFDMARRDSETQRDTDRQ